MKLLIIPARGGSKRIPNKNIKNFAGKPIIEWSIETGFNANYFDQIIVSTDDQGIKLVAESAGAKVPFIRPKNISGDFSTTLDVIKHAVNWYKAEGHSLTDITCLYPTSPLTTVKDLRQALYVFNNNNNIKQNAFIFSATKFPSSLQRAFYLNKSGFSKMFHPEYYSTRSQDLENAYYDAGQFYIASPNVWLEKDNIFEGSKPYFLPRWRVQDIDTLEDWEMAEKLFEINKIN